MDDGANMIFILICSHTNMLQFSRLWVKFYKFPNSFIYPKTIFQILFWFFFGNNNKYINFISRRTIKDEKKKIPQKHQNDYSSTSLRSSMILRLRRPCTIHTTLIMSEFDENMKLFFFPLFLVINFGLTLKKKN